MSKAISKNLLGNATSIRSNENLKKISSELNSISIKTEIMQQIGIDICTLPEVQGVKKNTLKIKVSPPLLNFFMSLYVGMDL